MTTPCPKCGNASPPGLLTCAACATPLGNLCPRCNFDNPPGFKFCGNCGTNLLTAPMRAPDEDTLRRLQSTMPASYAEKVLLCGKQMSGERRSVTVLFADVVGFTTISEQLDPEQVYGIIDACSVAFREEIHKHEGWVDKFLGDGVMALFGAPVAHEDDAARAIRAAMGIRDAMRRINSDRATPHGVNLQIRIGLNLGTVVVGNIGSDLRLEYTALGDCVNVASRLESVAEPGSILASRAVYEQTRALYDFRELGAIRLRGRIEPVEIFELEGLRREPGRVRGIPGLAAPMVGREAEMSELQRLLDRLTTQGKGSVALITGEPGIGKSRLLTEFKRANPGTRARVLEAGCSAYGENPYDLFIRFLATLFDQDPKESSDENRLRIERRVREVWPPGRPLAEVLPYVEHLLGLPVLDGEMAGRIRHLDAAQLRRQTFLAVRDLLLAESGSAPLLLIFEDLHWVDPVSLKLLLFLFGAVDSAPFSLICTARPIDSPIAAQILTTGKNTPGIQFVQLALQPLSLAESSRLIDLLLTISDLPEALRNIIPQRAEGNPFYLEEIIRMLIDRHIIVRRAEQWEMTPDADLSALEVPRTLEGLIMARVDSLPEATRHVLQCASVIGRDFSQELLRRIADGNGMRLESLLQDLQERELIVLSSQLPELRYAFRHFLTQQTVYSSLLLRRREHLHQRIAGAIEDLYHGQLQDHVEELAFHYAESKDAARALPYLLQAGERALARLANEQALDRLRSALDMANQCGAPVEQRVRCHSGMGEAQYNVGDYDGALASLRLALELERTLPSSTEQARQVAEIARRLGRVCERRGEYDQALVWLENALYDLNRDATSSRCVERARIYLDTGWVHHRLGHVDESHEWLRDALEVSEGRDYYPELGSAYNRLAALFSDKGDWAQAWDYARRGLAIRERIGDTDGVARSHLTLGVIAALRGDWNRAVEHFQASLELNRRLGQPRGISDAYTNLGCIHVLKGDASQAREYIRAGLEVAEKTHDPDQICQALNAFAEAELIDQNWNAAADLVRRSMQMALEIGAKERLAQSSWILAETELARGERAAADQSARHALQLAQELGIKELEAGAFRVLGKVERAGHIFVQAEADLQRSRAIFNELKNSYEAARAEFELALLYVEKGMPVDAQNLMTHCLETFARFDVPIYVERARTALTQIGPIADPVCPLPVQ